MKLDRLIGPTTAALIFLTLLGMSNLASAQGPASVLATANGISGLPGRKPADDRRVGLFVMLLPEVFHGLDKQTHTDFDLIISRLSWSVLANQSFATEGSVGTWFANLRG